MITVTGTNGFGSYKKNIRFSVPEDEADGLLNDGWECIGKRDGRSFFRFDITDVDRFDDETSIQALTAILPYESIQDIRI